MSTGNPSYTNPKPCKHLADYKLRHGLSGYRSLQKLLKTTPNGRTSVEKLDTKIPRCNSCNGFQGRLYFCLICSSVSCSDHTLLHSQSENGHDVAVDIERAELYCCVCCDQVYDPDFDKAVMSKHFMGSPRNKNGDESIGERLVKRRRLGSSVVEELVDLRKSKQLVSMRDRRAKSCYPFGLRGLTNLGSTCFMNSVLQALLHAPPFRNYFLSEGHNREACRKRSVNRLCLPCDIDDIFSAVFSGDRAPYSPAQFLYSWWQHSSNLASYQQQDAHEFFISVLDGIHEKESKSSNRNRDNGDCLCIAHKVFSGLLRSDVTCMTCGFTSTTYDPCVDISLDLDTNNLSPKNTANKPIKPNENSSMSTLLGCLDLFTRQEKLGSDQKLYCRNCQERRDSVKQMSIRRLPLVLCLHIKRFEHSPVRRMSRKIDRYLHFPFSLDMTPYLSSSIVRNRFGNRIFAFEGEESDISTEFEIFAVVTHAGTLESGHYVTYLRLSNQWYKCDDAWITEVDEGMVRASQCYVMFYVQKTLYHKANEDLSCLPISPRRDTFLPIAGCC
ncbi:ubiquitin C-terminal hydrolase 22 [Alnus glutinosa]|uniref:ubiquitin C-terminal hydrolase 22 n=1 Tax=Alnus glutinosa TaxID=3517 RepID=UPI002D779777|nr:ubiquitin C-terminal hydrolase 22 [Alnus glutinosa]XP_062164068.1 ubiquitin C-terminal hydrolase 22 [Alnus glutinosa]